MMQIGLNWSGSSMDVINTTLSVVVVVNLGLAILIYVYGRQKLIKIFYSLMVFVVFGWVLSMMLYRITGPENSVLWCRILYVVASFTSTVFFFFSLVFPENKLNLSSIVKVLVPIENIFLIVLIAMPGTIISDVQIRPGQEKLIIWGPYYFIYVIHILVYFSMGYLILFNKMRKAPPIEKPNLSLVYWGFFISGQIAFLTNLLMPWWGDTRLNWLGQVVTIFMLGFTGYAIVKHHLLNIRLIVAETVTYIAIVILAVEIILSKSLTEISLRIIFLIILSYGGYTLIKSMQSEIKQKEELQKLSTQLGQANDHLKELDAMKTEFVSLASHELLTPVSAIEGYLSMLLDEKMAKVEDPKAMRYLNNVYTSSKRLARLVADMLNVSRIEEGRLLVQKKELDLSKLLKDAVAEIKFKAEENKQKIVFDNPDGWVTFGDADKIKEVVINIIGNAIKYSKNPGTITIHITRIPTPWVSDKWGKVEEEIKSRPLDDQEAIKSTVDSHFRDFVGAQQILIAVKDDGIGIPKEELPRLFKKFHRVGDFTTAESQGTGLGLYISRALVELHHGRIWADSEGTGKGSTFTFSLPDISSKKELLELEGQVHQEKEQLKPLARPVKEAEEI